METLLIVYSAALCLAASLNEQRHISPAAARPATWDAAEFAAAFVPLNVPSLQHLHKHAASAGAVSARVLC